MSSIIRSRAQRLGPLGAVRGFISVLKEMSFDDVRDDAELSPSLIVLAADEKSARQLAQAIVGADSTATIQARTFDDPLTDAKQVDAVVVYDPERTGAFGRARQRFQTESGVAPVFAFEGRAPDDGEAISRLRRLLITRVADRAVAFGRACPALRPHAVKAVVDETAKANAQFALVSNIPSVIPIVGSLAAAGADFLVLTKNQVMMMFKLAAIHGRDLHNQWKIMQDLAPVVGAGLFWRTIAREAASFIPLAAGTIPKVAIAYAGTLSVGRAADYYYRTNRKPSRSQIQGYYKQAAEAVSKLPLPGKNGKTSAGGEADAIETNRSGQDERSSQSGGGESAASSDQQTNRE